MINYRMKNRRCIIVLEVLRIAGTFLTEGHIHASTITLNRVPPLELHRYISSVYCHGLYGTVLITFRVASYDISSYCELVWFLLSTGERGAFPVPRPGKGTVRFLTVILYRLS